MIVTGVLIGCGFFAENHMHAWRDLGVSIVAVCDSNEAKATDMAKRHGIAKHYTDAASMLAEERPHFVDIATPVPAHRQLVELAAQHRVPVICQKPFATTLEDADAMIAACKQADVPLMVHENFRWQTPMLAVQEALESSELGTPFFGRISFRHDFDVYAVQPYLAEVERFAILDVGLHLLDLARFYFGEVTAIACTTQRANPRVRGEDVATMLLKHASGATSIIDASFFTHVDPNPFPQTTVDIDCAAGAIRLLPGYDLTVAGPKRTTHKNVEPTLAAWMERPWHGVQESVRNFQEHWLDVLAGRATASTSGADNRRTLQLALLAYEAAERGEMLNVDG